MNVWVGWHKLHDGQGDMPIFQSKHEADKWVSQYKTGFAKLITLTEQKPWVGLTDDEIKDIIGSWGDTPIKGYTRKLFDQIEVKLKEKNNG